MKTLNLELTKEIFDAFELTTEEMINVRGGDAGGDGTYPTPPPTKI